MLRKTIALAILGASTATYAADDKGFYAGVGIGQSKVSDSEAGLSFDGTDTAFRIFGGYQINTNFSVEGAYIDVGAPDDKIQGINVELDATAFQAALLGKVPFNASLAGFAKAGILFWDSTITASSGLNFVSAEDSGNEFSWGLGLELSINPSAKARLEFEGADVDGTDFRMISLGFSWLFN
jgi:OOP family OmpA-OmpF porin